MMITNRTPIEYANSQLRPHGLIVVDEGDLLVLRIIDGPVDSDGNPFGVGFSKEMGDLGKAASIIICYKSQIEAMQNKNPDSSN